MINLVEMFSLLHALLSSSSRIKDATTEKVVGKKKNGLFIDDDCDVIDNAELSSFIFAAILVPMLTKKSLKISAIIYEE